MKIAQSLAKTLGLAALAVCVMAGCGQQPPEPAKATSTPAPVAASEKDAPTPGATPALPAEPVTVDNLTSATVLAMTGEGPVTMHMLASVLAFVELGGQPKSKTPMGDLKKLDPAKLDRLAKAFAIRRTAYNDLGVENPMALQEMLGINAELMKSFASTRISAIRKGFLQNEVTAKMSKPAETELRKTYDTHREEFKQEYAFWMRHLILLTYKGYAVEAGDTLESIAAKFSVPEDEIENIRADVPSRPPRREEGKLFKPLVKGEKLLIPMTGEEADARREELIDILRKMNEENKSFVEIANEYSDSDVKGEEIGPLPSGTRPILGQLVEVASHLDPGQISTPFRTKHGWQAIEITRKREAGYRAFDEVRGVIVNKLKQMEHYECLRKAIDSLYEQPDLTIHFDKIAQGEKLRNDPVVIEFKDLQWRWESDYVKSYWEGLDKPTQPKEIEIMLHRFTALQSALLSDWYINWTAKNPGSPMEQQVEALKIAHFGTAALSHLAAGNGREKLSDADIEAFYQQHLDDLFAIPAQYVIDTWEIHLSGDELAGPIDEHDALLNEYREQLLGDLQQVETVDDFKDRATMANEIWRGSTPIADYIGKPTKLDAMPEAYRSIVSGLSDGAWSAPIVESAEKRVVAILREASKPAEHMPFTDKNKDVVIKALLDTMQPELVAELEKEYVAKSHYKCMVAE